MLILTFLAYLPILWADFVTFDDTVYVLENRHVLKGLTTDGILWAFRSGEGANWHPLTWISHMLDVSLYGLNPSGHHATNLILHLANTFLLFNVLRHMTGAPGPSWIVAALFALHPLHVESVAWISERKDVLCGFFGLLTLDAYRRHVCRPESSAYWLALFWFTAGLAAKPMLVTLPFLLLLLDFWPLKRMGSAGPTGLGHAVVRLIVEKIPFLALSAASCVVTFQVQQASGAVRGLESLPFDLRLQNALLSYAAYLVKMFWPTGLAAYYPYSPAAARAYGVVSGLFLIAISVAALRTASSRPYLAVGWLWYLGMLVPVIGLVQVGTQAMADRYTYLPLIGIFLMMAYGAQDIWQGRRSQTALVAAGMAILVALVGMTVRQVNFWHGPVTLTQRMIAVTQGNSPAAYNLLGTALERERRPAEAETAFRKALALKACYRDARFNLANLLAGDGRYEEALALFQAVLASNSNDTETLNNLAGMLLKMGHAQEAVVNYQKILALNPGAVDVQSNLGAALLVAGRIPEALVYLRKAAEVGADIMFQRNLGVGLMAAGRWREAERCFMKVLAVLPRHPETLRDLDLARQEMGAEDSKSRSDELQ